MTFRSLQQADFEELYKERRDQGNISVRQKTEGSERPENALDCVGGNQAGEFEVRRLELNDPPAAAGGIQEGEVEFEVRRLELNDPPASGGGIQEGYPSSRPVGRN